MPHATRPRVKFKIVEVHQIYDALACVPSPEERRHLQILWDTKALKAALVGFTQPQLEETQAALRHAFDHQLAQAGVETASCRACTIALRLVGEGLIHLGVPLRP